MVIITNFSSCLHISERNTSVHFEVKTRLNIDMKSRVPASRSSHNQQKSLRGERTTQEVLPLLFLPLFSLFNTHCFIITAASFCVPPFFNLKTQVDPWVNRLIWSSTSENTTGICWTWDQQNFFGWEGLK